VVWAFGATYGVFWVVNKIRAMRVSPEVELEGLDVPQFGLPGYPEDMVSAEA
jgi:Amt family ammonium transporter